MTSMSDATWPPSDEVASWKPSADSPEDSVPGWVLAGDDDGLPEWVAVPDGIEPDEHGDLDVPAYALAHVETDSGRPGGGGISSIYAVPTTDGGVRIVISNDDEIPFSSPIDRLDGLPTVADLLQILDETEVDGEAFGVGHPTRENSDSEHREELRGFVTIRSALYPVIEQLDRSRLDQWIAERP